MSKRNMKFWALLASVCVHILVLAVFAFARFSEGISPRPEGTIPNLTIQQARNFMSAVMVTPKPKVKRVIEQLSAAGISRLQRSEDIFQNKKVISAGMVDTAGAGRSVGEYSFGDDLRVGPSVEFFDSSSSERKICYVVDCSGSMHGMLARVRDELKESIAALEADQYFGIIFFGGGKVFEFADGRLVRASKKAKLEADSFVDSIRPEGSTNALRALERAVKMRDDSHAGPGVIYFLTDGFELGDAGGEKIVREIAGLLASYLPGGRIDTIGFWPQEDDRRTLEMIAARSGGKFIMVVDRKAE